MNSMFYFLSAVKVGGPEEKLGSQKNFLALLTRIWAPHFNFALYAPEASDT